MVKKRNKNNKKTSVSKRFNEAFGKARKINASTAYETCTEQLSPFGGLLPLIKFIDLIDLRQIFESTYKAPKRDPKLGHFPMVVGLLMLLFIGFNRIWHFSYIRLDAMLCGFFRVTCLPVASTFWRYVNSMGLNQGKSLIKVMAKLRERVWQVCDLSYSHVYLDIDTTVETVFGDQQGARKGHNTKNRGKKGYRPVLCFIEQSREYLIGKFRRGRTMSGIESAAFIGQIKAQLPACVQQVLIRGDAEFQSPESVHKCFKEGYDFIFANKSSKPPFDPQLWYQPYKKQPYEYNSCIYQPFGWLEPVRFVVMRIPKENVKEQNVQYELFEEDRYTYRIFSTNLRQKAHEVIALYDKRADVENLMGESKREGLDAIPSSRFKNNYAYFQIVMLAYNIWRYLKIMAEHSSKYEKPVTATPNNGSSLKGIKRNTIRIARLRLLMIAAKVVMASNRDKIRYSIHDSRTPALFSFLKYLDLKRAEPKPWCNGVMAFN